MKIPTAREVHDFLQGDPDAFVKNLYNGDCRGCGECCSRFIPLSARDIQRVSSYVAAHSIEQIPERGDVDLLCPYLSDRGECMIYDARPDICRAYRCDFHAHGDLALIALIMSNGPYQDMDMREVIEQHDQTC